MMRMATVTDTLRRAVEQCGQSRYAIAKATGIDKAVLSRFVASGRGLRSDNFDRLCAHLGLVLATKPGKTRKGR
jgi:DNA-binding Xre family transcriptional regulator